MNLGATQVVYICSTGHSGSTLLDLLLGSNTNAASLGEISFLSRSIAKNDLCTCKKSINKCNVWKDIISEVSNELHMDIWKNPYYLDLGYPPYSIEEIPTTKQKKYNYIRRIVLSYRYLYLRYGLLKITKFYSKYILQDLNHLISIYNSASNRLNVDTIVDSSKSYISATTVYNRYPNNVKLIHIYRDGRAIFYSYYKRGFDKKICFNAWKRHYTRSIPLFKKRVNEKNILKVKYEDLVLRTDQVLKNICSFINIEYQENMLDWASKEHHSIDGNNMRFVESSEIIPDFKWKDKLPTEMLEYFNSMGRRLNEKLGYT